MRATAILFVFAIFSCGQSKYEKDISTLDSLKAEVVKVKEQYNNLDTTSMLEISKEVSANLRQLPKIYQPDSIDMKIAGLINYYKSFRKSGVKFTMQRVRVRADIPYTIKQLDNLITDLKNNSLVEEEARKYIESEKNAAIYLTNTFAMIKLETQKAKNNFDSVRVHMNRLIDSLKSDSANVQAIRLKNLKSKTKKAK